MGRKYSFRSGRVRGKVVQTGLAVLKEAATMTLEVNQANVFTLIPAHTATINATMITKNVGQRITLVVTTSGTNSYTLTFGTNFKTTGTLATGTADAKVFVIDFICDGVNLCEVARTTAM